jgi:hypothetical protein
MMLMVVAPALAMAQISVYVQSPPDIAGPLNFTWNDDSLTWVLRPNLNDLANAVEDTLALVDDGTTADTLGCEALVNGGDINGKIAVVYRGSCEFGMKALNAQNEGAVAVIIINNITGPPVGMGAGAVGDQISIPVVMVSDVDGAMLRDRMAQEPVVVRIGTLTNFFPYNLSVETWGIVTPPAAALPAELALDEQDLSIEPGGYILNYGSASQSNVRLQLEVTQDGNTVYDETSAETTVAPGDTVYFTLPTFQQTSYSGRYEFTYSVLSDNPDSYTLNDTIEASLQIGDVFSYAEVDEDTGIPISDRYISPAGVTTAGWRSCVYFTHPNASRVAATGLYVSVSAHQDSVFAGNFIQIQGNEWVDPITDYNTLPSATGLLEEASGDHVLTEGDRAQPIYVPFIEPLVLQDNGNYLFCLISTDARTWHGWDDEYSYDQHQLNNLAPLTVLEQAPGGTWYTGFVGINAAASIGVHMIDVNTIGINENDQIEITPFPNPTVDHIRIPVAGQEGVAALQIFSVTGELVAEQRVRVNAQEQILVDMQGISNGTYMFNMAFENGKRASFRVVVSR